MSWNNFSQKYCYYSCVMYFLCFLSLKCLNNISIPGKYLYIHFTYFLLLSVSFLTGSFPGWNTSLHVTPAKVFTQTETRHISCTASVFLLPLINFDSSSYEPKAKTALFISPKGHSQWCGPPQRWILKGGRHFICLAAVDNLTPFHSRFSSCAN